LRVFPDGPGEQRAPDQLGERVDVHLRHDVRPVHLDGLRTQPELERDLLVRLAGDHEMEHLALSRGERREPLARVLAPRAYLARVAIELERLAYAIQHELIAVALLGG